MVKAAFAMVEVKLGNSKVFVKAGWSLTVYAVESVVMSVRVLTNSVTVKVDEISVPV